MKPRTYPVKLYTLPPASTWNGPPPKAKPVPGFVVENARSVDDALAQARKRLEMRGTVRSLSVLVDGGLVATIEERA